MGQGSRCGADNVAQQQMNPPEAAVSLPFGRMM